MPSSASFTCCSNTVWRTLAGEAASSCRGWEGACVRASDYTTGGMSAGGMSAGGGRLRGWGPSSSCGVSLELRQAIGTASPDFEALRRLARDHIMLMITLCTFQLTPGGPLPAPPTSGLAGEPRHVGCQQTLTAAAQDAHRYCLRAHCCNQFSAVIS